VGQYITLCCLYSSPYLHSFCCFLSFVLIPAIVPILLLFVSEKFDCRLRSELAFVMPNYVGELFGIISFIKLDS